MWKVKSSLKNWRNERLLSFRVFVKILTALIYLMWWWFLVRPWLCTRPPYKLSYSYYYCYYTIIIIIIVIRIITSITIIINLRPFIDIIKHWYTHSHGCTEIPEEILTWRLPHQLDRSRIPPPPAYLHLATSEMWCWSGGILKKLSLCYSIVYYYNGAQRYEQFLQVGRLYRALILLGLALYLYTLPFSELSLVRLALDLVD